MSRRSKNQRELVEAVRRQNNKTTEALRRLVTDHLTRKRTLEDRLMKSGLSPCGRGFLTGPDGKRQETYLRNDRAMWRVVEQLTDHLMVGLHPLIHPDPTVGEETTGGTPHRGESPVVIPMEERTRDMFDPREIRSMEKLDELGDTVDTDRLRLLCGFPDETPPKEVSTP